MSLVRALMASMVLLAGCGTGAVETAASVNAAPTDDTSETVIAATKAPAPLQSGDTTASTEPVPLESVGTEVRDDDGFISPMEPVTLPAGTYRSSTYHVPVTFTTTDELTLIGLGVTLTSDDTFSSIVEIGQPDQVVDLSSPVTLEEAQQASGELPVADGRLIEVPADVGAWLDDAAAIDIIGDGSTMVDGRQVPWWDVELQDGDLVCGPQPNVPPCQPLWFGGRKVGPPGAVVASAVARVWAIPVRGRTVLVTAGTSADDDANTWLEKAEDIVASLQFD